VNLEASFSLIGQHMVSGRPLGHDEFLGHLIRGAALGDHSLVLEGSKFELLFRGGNHLVKHTQLIFGC
jgi:hypothetical protein